MRPRSDFGGIESRRVVRQTDIGAVHPDYREFGQRREFATSRNWVGEWLQEQKHLKLNGEVIDVEVAACLRFQGRPAVQAVIRDITDRRRGREALRQTEARLRTVVSSASLILFALDQNGVVTLSEGEGLKAIGGNRARWWAIGLRSLWRQSGHHAQYPSRSGW